jgi:hypothetical protein
MNTSRRMLATSVFGLLVAFAATEASAQVANLSGRYICVQNCRSGPPGTLAFITQNGQDLNLSEEGGASSRAWPDWFNPNKIWADNWNQNAVVSPDGMTIQFDRGAVWERAVEVPPPSAIRRTVVRVKPAPR